MSLRSRLAQVRGVTSHDRERGFTLTEVVASMSIMTIFMVMFTSSIVQLYGSSNKANAVSESSDQINTAFSRLDHQIRYAAAIDQPTLVNGSWYVEFLSQNTGTSVCTQLRLSQGVLAERIWSPPPAVAPTWNAIASGITNPAAMTPFTFYPADPGQDPVHVNQRLQVKLQATSGTNDAHTDSTTDVTFTALNSSASTTTNVAGNTVCIDQGRN